MPNVIRPLEIFSKAAARSSCVWLGECAARSGERACWQWMWNGGESLVHNCNCFLHFSHNCRSGELQSPTAICGHVKGLGELTKKLYREKQCEFAADLNENRSDLIDSLDFLRGAKAVPTIVVLGGISGRADRMLATLHALVLSQSLSSRAFIPPFIFVLDGDNLLCVLRQGSHRFQFDRSHLTDVCGIAPICQSETLVTTSGFRWNLQRSPLSFAEVISTSNELTSEEITVNNSAPVILTFELLSSITGLTEPPK
ncbi:hypothetical protein PENTCL1PPCAC_14679, partial [Pristionchus entomophagus]